ncbi:MAG: dual specificity protein phosphatase family protein [Planctomycetota bacterium]|jgi:atypical dual specificity phosphatase|nr:dual specificity protein phosphatase family protein [Planctomycetota bacterium]
MLANFSYLLPGKLAGSGKPGRFSRLQDDLDTLIRRKIRAIVTLTEDALDPKLLQGYPFRTLHLPVADFTAPSQGQLDAFVEFVDTCLGEDLSVLVHCGAGIGRTGVMLAGYLIHTGDSPQEAIKRLRQVRPGSIETREQEECLFNYHRRQQR